jgi:4-hydroxyphenylpyruvate dioxygenase
MKMSIATVSLSGDLVEKLDAIASAGFSGVEIYDNDLMSFNGSAADVRKIAADLGLEIVAFQPFRDFEGTPAAKRERVFSRAERKFDLMQELGCELLVVCSNTAADSSGDVVRAAADLHELGERASARGLRIGFKALAWARHIKDYRQAWEVVRSTDHRAVGLVVDSFHTFASQADPAGLRSIPGDRIFLAHLADASAIHADLLAQGRHFTNFPGQGELPLLAFLDALQATGFDGPLSLEIFNDQARAGSARGTAVDGRRSLLFLLDQLRERVPGAQTSLVRLPPRSKCLGTEFIEFAIDEGSAVGFEKVLRGLGFARTGVHKSKSVTRWQQGAINIVINTEKEGFAHAYNIMHGTTVCAIGLTVEDAAATLRRAEGLLDQPFHQAVGPGELEIPAVRGVGGSLLYFIDRKSDLGRVWDIEFEPAEVVSGPQAGLLSVDHISQSMRYEEMLSWLLFYSSLFDISKLPIRDVLDPGGLVKSQVLQTSGGELRLILNASQSKHALSSRFLTDAFGSGVQHIALATSDILATAQRIEANGLGVLAVPENYYDELESTTDLSVEQIGALKAHNVLYDRDEAGEYLQMYTRTYEQGFFFEIVERRGYRGFGAANAPIRLAAQARLWQDEHSIQ